MLYSDSEKAWIDRRALQIEEERGWPLPIARSEACAELVRTRATGRSATILSLDRSRSSSKNPPDSP